MKLKQEFSIIDMDEKYRKFAKKRGRYPVRCEMSRDVADRYETMIRPPIPAYTIHTQTGRIYYKILIYRGMPIHVNEMTSGRIKFS